MAEAASRALRSEVPAVAMPISRRHIVAEAGTVAVEADTAEAGVDMAVAVAAITSAAPAPCAWR
jgi:hypothetical protein